MEFLPPAELRRAEVRDLLVRHGVAPMLAAPAVAGGRAVQADADAEVAAALADYRQAGLLPCAWPLLSDEEGYWPSAWNAEQVGLRVHALLAAAERAGVPLQSGDVIAVDLEPPLQAARSAGVHDPAASKLAALLAGCDEARFAAATAALSRLAVDLRARGLRSLAIAYPLVSGDRPGEHEWARRCVAPLDCGWDRVAIMTYASIIAGYSRGLLGVSAARRYGYRAQAALARRFPGRAGAFIGICGTGKLGNEPAHRDPTALVADAAAAWAAGAVEVSAFCLEGVLAQPEPGRWLSALSAPAAAASASVVGDLLYQGTVLAGQALRRFTPRGG